MKQYRPKEGKKRKLPKLKLDFIFSWSVDHKKLYQNCEDSNFIRSPFTIPTQKKGIGICKKKKTPELLY